MANTAQQPDIQSETQSEIQSEIPVTEAQAEVVDLHEPVTEQIQAEETSQANTNRALLFIMSGFHKGAGATIDAETSIGSGFDNDLILTDDDIAPKHLTFKPHETKLDYGIELTCIGENVMVNNEMLLTKDQSLTIYNSCIVTIGTVNINVTIYKSSKLSVAYKKYMKPQIQTVENITVKTKKYLSPSVILSDVRNIILAAIVVLLIIAGIAYLFTMKKTKEPMVSPYAAIENIPTITPKEKANKSEIHKEAKEDLTYIMKKYDLASRLDVSIYKDIIYVKGSINQYELQNWTKVLNWFDITYGASKINLVPIIEVNNGLRRTISFKAIVAHGSMPYVVSWTGDRFKVGATLPGGWIILKIADDGVVVRDAIDNRIFLVNHIRSQHGEAVPEFIE